MYYNTCWLENVRTNLHELVDTSELNLSGSELNLSGLTLVIRAID